MSKNLTRDQVQTALRAMADKAREARDAYRRELAACRKKGLLEAGADRPASLTERFAHWNTAHMMLYIAVSQLLFSGKNNSRVYRYVNDLINGERWPTESE